ncbi:MAG TPA: hypothetical protein VHA33_00355 [Candidatus Angelobacter sp.]|nr:hypothetical protein [Candidatus Angelobacter sp.]
MSRTFSQLFSHLVFSTKQRARLIVPDLNPHQEEHHRKFSYEEELVALLHKHGIDYDERYLWD